MGISSGLSTTGACTRLNIKGWLKNMQRNYNTTGKSAERIQKSTKGTMKEKMNTEQLNDRDWEELALYLSEEKGSQPELVKQFLSEEGQTTGKQWKEIRNMSHDKTIAVDKAW